MTWAEFDNWLSTTSLLALSVIALVTLVIAVVIGTAVRARRGIAETGDAEGQEGYVVAAVLGLMALLLGFTFSLAVDRFETRRALVLEEANAIGTTYLRTQLLNAPHRERITGLLVRYLDNRIALGGAIRPEGDPKVAVNDQILVDLWAATAAAFPDIKGLDFSSTYIDSMNNLIDLDAARKAARSAHVPGEVFLVLFIYLAVTAGVLGYVLVGPRGRIAAGFLLLLLLMSLGLIIDIDRPTIGGIRENQGPMIALRTSIRAQPTAVYDRWLVPPAEAVAAPAPARTIGSNH